MKIKHIWSVLSKGSVLNQDDNVISIQNVLEELQVGLSPAVSTDVKIPEKIVIPLEYEITSMWLKEDKNEEFNINIDYSLISPSGKQLLKATQKAEMKKGHTRHRTRMKISGLPLEGEGLYYFVVTVSEKEEEKSLKVVELPLEVKIITGPLPEIKNSPGVIHTVKSKK